jgi:hypothetical protein
MSNIMGNKLLIQRLVCTAVIGIGFLSPVLISQQLRIMPKVDFVEYYDSNAPAPYNAVTLSIDNPTPPQEIPLGILFRAKLFDDAVLPFQFPMGRQRLLRIRGIHQVSRRNNVKMIYRAKVLMDKPTRNV